MPSKTSAKMNLEELRKRAKQRTTTLSMNPKSEKEIDIEKDFFKIIENQIYTQIARN